MHLQTQVCKFEEAKHVVRACEDLVNFQEHDRASFLDMRVAASTAQNQQRLAGSVNAR